MSLPLTTPHSLTRLQNSGSSHRTPERKRQGLAITADALDPSAVESTGSAARQSLRDPWAISSREAPRVASALIIDVPKEPRPAFAASYSSCVRSRLARQLGRPSL